MGEKSGFNFVESLCSRLLLFLCLLQKCLLYRYIPEHEVAVPMYLSYSKNPVIEITDAPHHALIVYGTKYCSGSLIGSRTVVTAASCFDKNRGEPIFVKLGSSSMVGDGQTIPVTEYKIHEYYKFLSYLDNDIALLMLQDHVTFGENVLKAILIEPEIALRVGAPVNVTGWGGTNLPVKYVNSLLQSEMFVIDKVDCRKQFGGLITRSNFCVKYNLEHYLSDNGGGAIHQDLLVGILSSGAGKQDGRPIAILTNVSYFHRWILLNTKRFLTKNCVIRVDDVNIMASDSTEYKET